MSAPHGRKTRRQDSMQRLNAFLGAAQLLLWPEQVQAIWARAVQDQLDLNWPSQHQDAMPDASEET